jgi:hypothetical protein
MLLVKSKWRFCIPRDFWNEKTIAWETRSEEVITFFITKIFAILGDESVKNERFRYEMIKDLTLLYPGMCKIMTMHFSSPA